MGQQFELNLLEYTPAQEMPLKEPIWDSGEKVAYRPQIRIVFDRRPFSVCNELIASYNLVIAVRLLATI